MAPLLAIVCLCALAVNAQDVANSTPVEVDYIHEVDCLDYYWNYRHFETCKGIKRKPGYGLDNVSALAKEICRNRKKITSCMNEAVASCSNAAVLAEFTIDSFGFCDSEQVRPVMADFFRTNAGKSIGRSCIFTVMKEVEDLYGKAPFDGSERSNIATEISRWKSLYTWYVTRFHGMDLDMTLVECDGMTRRTVYGIMIASLEVRFKWATDFYGEFINMVEE